MPITDPTNEFRQRIARLEAQATFAAPAGSATLELTLIKKWFDKVKSGEKKQEYRRRTHWIMVRLLNRKYKRVRFRNGYRPDSPVIDVEYKGWEERDGQIVIKLGRILSPNR